MTEALLRLSLHRPDELLGDRLPPGLLQVVLGGPDVAAEAEWHLLDDHDARFVRSFEVVLAEDLLAALGRVEAVVARTLEARQIPVLSAGGDRVWG